MVEVFKTNVCNPEVSVQIIAMLSRRFPGSRINFDLEDCDKILRVEHTVIPTGQIIELLEESGFQCEVLE